MVQDLGKMSEELTYVLLHIKPGETRLVKIQEEDDLLQLSIHAVEIRIGEEFIVVSSIANLQNVLEYQETESWQKLIRVLTHEIMNSIAPIASLSSTLNQIMTGNNEDTVCEDLSTEELEEIRGALQTIHKRSTGLLHFVESYRNLTRIPQPNFRIAKIDRMLRQIATLNYEQLKRHGIDFEIIVCPEDMEVSIDEELISQVLINLIQNSIHALEETEKPKIEINGFYNKRGRPTLTVKDNGPGILPDVIDKIFIPFFTTKPEGSGIGLSLSKQILRLHNGTITAKSQPGNDTTFILTF
jgi:signal transduction histidine kinase